MNRNKFVIGTTLAILLCSATNAYASWSMYMSSSLSTGLLNITGYSVTSSDVTCSTIYAYNAIYEDGVLKANKEVTNSNSKSATTQKNSTPNHVGTQKWESYGIHNAVYNGDAKLDSTLKTANY